MSLIDQFSAIKAFYEADGDFLSLFSHYALQGCPSQSNPCSLPQVREDVKKKTRIDIPIDVLKTIIKRLKRKGGFVDYGNIETSIYLTPEGEVELKSIEKKIKDSARESNALFNVLSAFLSDKKKKTISVEKAKEQFYLFLRKYLHLSHLLDKENLVEDRGITELIKEFIFYVENEDPENFNRLQNLLHGFLLLSVLEGHSLENVKTKIADLSVYLDSNVVFSILGLHGEVYAQSAKDLLHLLKKNNIPIKVWGFTLREIRGVLMQYAPKASMYPPHIPIDSIYSRLRIQGTSPQDVLLLVGNLPEKLAEYGIDVDNAIDFKALSGKISDQEKSDIDKFGHDPKYPAAKKHDLASLHAIKDRRGGKRMYRLEDAKALFVTGDITLVNFCIKSWNNGLGSDMTLPEAILPEAITQLLWVKNPEFVSRLALHNLMSSTVSKTLIKNNLWEKFLAELEKQKKKGEITEKDITSLMGMNEIGRALIEFQSSEKPKSLPTFITKQISISRTQTIEMQEKMQDLLETKDKGDQRIHSVFEILIEKAEATGRKWAKVTAVFIVLFLVAVFLLGTRYLLTKFLTKEWFTALSFGDQMIVSWATTVILTVLFGVATIKKIYSFFLKHLNLLFGKWIKKARGIEEAAKI